MTPGAAIGMLWLLGLLWPLMGIHPDGTLTFANALKVWLAILGVTSVLMLLYVANKSGSLNVITLPLMDTREKINSASGKVPFWVWIIMALAFALALEPSRD